MLLIDPFEPLATAAAAADVVVVVAVAVEKRQKEAHEDYEDVAAEPRLALQAMVDADYCDWQQAYPRLEHLKKCLGPARHFAYMARTAAAVRSAAAGIAEVVAEEVQTVLV